MAIRTKDEILEQLKTRIGDEPDDESIAFLEDVTDTISDYESKIGDTEDWKSKYEANDKEWRKKYTDRFFNPSPTDKPDDPVIESDSDDTDDSNKKKTFDDLFTDGKEK